MSSVTVALLVRVRITCTGTLLQVRVRIRKATWRRIRSPYPPISHQVLILNSTVALQLQYAMINPWYEYDVVLPPRSARIRASVDSVVLRVQQEMSEDISLCLLSFIGEVR